MAEISVGDMVRVNYDRAYYNSKNASPAAVRIMDERDGWVGIVRDIKSSHYGQNGRTHYGLIQPLDGTEIIAVWVEDLQHLTT